jgi:phosphoribosylaminoimidazolecarboxamide formyltransferase/IMP cyclohydrolase
MPVDQRRPDASLLAFPEVSTDDTFRASHAMTLRPISRALLSVSDKTGLIDFARSLAAHGVALISTGGTAKALRDAGLAVSNVSAVTGFPEIMDGRVKTLHPKIHGGLLALRDKPDHAEAMRVHGIEGIDLLVCNLYPFEATVERGADFDETIENIDIGGPAMIRAASKNHDWVTVVVDPEDYAAVLAEMDANKGATSAGLRRKLAQIAYARTAAYDAAVSNWFAGELAKTGDVEPRRRRAFAGTLRQGLRYGENPHQEAAFYVTGEKRFGVATAAQLQGKELSYNNINDTDAAYELVAEFDPAHGAACAIIKHANPCGVALGDTLADAYRKALACDPVSAFGGILAFNRVLDGATAEEIAKLFTEVIIAPDADADARRILAAKKNLRLLLAGGLPDPQASGLTVRTVAGGFLLQTRDNAGITRADLKIVTKRQPSEAEIADMLFAFTIAKHVKSNTIVYAKALQTAGIGAGQMSRVDSARIAALKARDAAAAAGWAEPLTVGSAAASDAFFPFPDGLLAVAEAGATAVIQPGGSIRDNDVIEAADKAGLAMAFTGVRHFRH